MSKKFNLTTEQNKQINKAIHAFNEKIRYHNLKGDEVSRTLPDKESARELKKSIGNMIDFNREYARLRRFGSADVTETVKIGRYGNIEITKYERDELKRQQININRRKARKLENVNEQDVTVGGKKSGYKRAQMPSFRTADLSKTKLNFDTFESKDAFKAKTKTIKAQASNLFFDKRAQGYKDSYIRALKGVYGSKYARPLIEKIQSMSAKDVENKYYTEQDATIEYLYTPTSNENAKIENLYRIWGVDTDLIPEQYTVEI